ncbi:MAG: hypothetical protein EOM12_09195 [Verrucomicrobiae bacterium]|nr:hypothetical protein [Verrucomicrobiae bacterium]
MNPYYPASQLGRMVRYIRGLKHRSLVPSVVFLGSSRFQSAILPEVFLDEDETGRVRFMNWSQPSFGWWEFSKVFSRVDLDLLDIRVFVVEVNPWTFSTHSRDPITKKISRYSREAEYWGNVQDIPATDGFLSAVELVYRMCLPRRSLYDWVIAVKLCLEPSRAFELDPPRYHGDKEAEEKQRNNPHFFPENISRCHMLNYTFSEPKANQFKRFLRKLAMQGAEVILVHPPVVAEYYGYVNSDEARRREFKKHKKFLDELSLEYMFVNWQLPSDAQLTDDIFVDYGHCTLSGASSFSKRLTGRLRSEVEQAVARDGL